MKLAYIDSCIWMALFEGLPMININISAFLYYAEMTTVAQTTLRIVGEIVT